MNRFYWSAARGNAALVGLAFVSPVLTYLLELRFSQLVGPQGWLDEFRTLQIPLVGAIMAATVLFPQVVVPKAAYASSSGPIDWGVIKRVQKKVLGALALAALVVMLRPEWLAQVLTGRPTQSSGLLIAAIRPFGLGILVTLAGGLNASCLMADGNDAWLYTISMGPTLGALCCLQTLGVGSRLLSISMFTLGGALLFYTCSAGALLNRYLRREIRVELSSIKGFRIFGARDVQLAGALIANQLSGVVLNRMLIADGAGVASTFGFAFKIISVVSLPSIVMANHLLASLPSAGIGPGVRARMAGRSAVWGLGYSLIVVTVVVLMGDHLVHTVFFKAKFTSQQYADISATLRALVLGLPASVQSLIWARVNALAHLTHLTLAGAFLTLTFCCFSAVLQQHMNMLQVAMVWTTSVSLQSAVLSAGNPVNRLGTAFLNGRSSQTMRSSDAVALTLLTTSVAVITAELVQASEYSALIVVLGCNLFCVMMIWRSLPPQRTVELPFREHTT